MAAGISDTLWSMADLAEMVDAAQPKPGKRGPYKKARGGNFKLRHFRSPPDLDGRSGGR
jgi:hypothetical protein